MTSPSLSNGPRSPWASVLVVGAVAGLGLLTLDSRDVWAPDEPKYLLVAKEMVSTGQWLIPHVNSEPYPDKPPLMFWMIAIFARVLGRFSHAAAALPSVIGAVAALLGTRALTLRLAHGREDLALLAVVLLAGSYRFFMQIGFGQLDMLLCAFTTWAIWAFASDHQQMSARDALTAGICMGLATLTKGPPGLIVPLLAVPSFAFLRPSGRTTWVKSRLLSFRMWLTGFVVIGLWLVPAGVEAMRTGREAWLYDLLFRQTVVRYADPWHHVQPPWYLLSVLPVEFFPTILIVPLAVFALFRRKNASLRTRCALALAALLVLLFFSISPAKRGLYLLPIYPLLAVWCAIEVSERRSRAVRIALVVFATIATIAAVAISQLGEQLIARELDPRLTRFAFAFAIPAAFGLLLALRRNAGVGAMTLWFASWLVVPAAVYGLVLPRVDPLKSPREFVQQVREATREDAGLGMIRFRAQFGLHFDQRLDAAEPRDLAAVSDLNDALGSRAPYVVICREQERDLLVEDGEPMTVVADRVVGSNRYMAIANTPALKNANSGEQRP